MVFSNSSGQYGAPAKQKLPQAQAPSVQQSIGGPSPNRVGRYPAVARPNQQVASSGQVGGRPEIGYGQVGGSSGSFDGQQQPSPQRMPFPKPENRGPVGPGQGQPQPGDLDFGRVSPAQERKDREAQRQRELIKQYLAGDVTYQDQTSQLQKALEDFRLQNLDTRANMREDYKTTRGSMGQQRSQDLDSMLSDFAARGLATSGQYTDANSDYSEQFRQSLSNLTTDRDRGLSELVNQLRQFRGNTSLEQQNARREALRRRAVELGIM